MKHTLARHTVKSWPGSINGRQIWAWQCGRCTAGGWTHEWATAWSALDNHVHLGHMKNAFKNMFANRHYTRKGR